MIVLLVLPLVAVLVLYVFKQREHIRSLQNQCDSFSNTNREQEKKIDELKGDVASGNKKASDTARAYRTKETSWNTRTSEAQHRLTKLQNDFDRLQDKYSRDLRAAQDELQALREQRDELKKLVETQAVELTAAREFTFMTDQVSASDVSRTVQDLNSTIYQTAMQLISIEQPTPPTTPSVSPADMERLQVQARNYSVNAIGERLLRLAQTVGKDDESFPILAFQSGIAQVCFSAISSWVFGHGHELPQNEILTVAYEQIWASGTCLPHRLLHS